VYGGMAAITFAGAAGALLFVVALLLTAWSPIFAAIVALIAAIGMLVAMSALRRTQTKGPPATGSLTESGEAAQEEAGAVTESPRKQRPAAPGAR
jgi:hypothetical protein